MRCATLLGVMLGMTVSTAGQSPVARPITARPLVFATTFSAISHLVELADGRVLLHDPIEQKLGIADLRRGAFDELARQGQGPMEYRSVLAMHRVAGDSILIWDPRNNRVIAVAPDGSMLGPWGHTSAARLSGAQPGFIDRSGHWFVPMRQVSTGDTTFVVRLRPGADRRDTLVGFPTSRIRPTRGADGVIRVTAPGFPAVDAWGVFPDGRVLFLRGDQYRPEVFHPDGSRTRGAAVPFTPVRVTAADRATHLRDTEADLRRMLGAELRAGAQGGALPKLEAVDPGKWPTHLPPLRSSEIRVDSRDRAWVMVHDAARDTGDRYDLIDATGRRVDAIRLPEGVKLLAMGRTVFYATREDGDGLVQLLRYPLP
jgi:hypothetical protein